RRAWTWGCWHARIVPRLVIVVGRFRDSLLTRCMPLLPERRADASRGPVCVQVLPLTRRAALPPAALPWNRHRQSAIGMEMWPPGAGAKEHAAYASRASRRWAEDGVGESDRVLARSWSGTESLPGCRGRARPGS